MKFFFHTNRQREKEKNRSFGRTYALKWSEIFRLHTWKQREPASNNVLLAWSNKMLRQPSNVDRKPGLVGWRIPLAGLLADNEIILIRADRLTVSRLRAIAGWLRVARRRVDGTAVSIVRAKLMCILMPSSPR